MSDVREVLSALIDREPVDADVLAQALEDPAHRALLVDFVRVRAAVTEDETEEAAGYPGHGSRLTAHAIPAPGSGLRAPAATASRPGSLLPAPGRSRWLRAAAVFALLAAGAGGGAWMERYVTQERPPEPDRVVRLDPVPVPATAQAIDARRTP